MTTSQIIEIMSDQNNIIMQNDLGNEVVWRNKTRHALCVYRNIEARSSNHCCRGKAVSVTYCECVIIQGLSKRFEHLLLWPPRSPDLTPCDFFLKGYVKDNAYKPQTARSHSSCGANRWWEHVEVRLAGVRLSFWHLQSNEGRSHWAFVSWFW